MKLDELVRYGIPGEMIARWREEGHERLLPLQEAAVKRHGLFGRGNLLIQAPTSSGKTFVGELAAVETALRRKQVIYLAPLKALAEEKYRTFQQKYGAYGLDVILSTRDHRRHDRRLESGNFSLAIVVYEKLAQLLVRRPERLAEVDLVIADELEILSDPDRGGTVEILLTRMLQSGCRLIGLSAVLGQAEELAQWLDAELVRHDQRPVELRYGVLHDGVFHYRTHNSAEEGEERLAGDDKENAQQVLEENVVLMTERGETCLLFVKSKHEARQAALRLAERLDEAPARDALAELARCERTRSREWLEQTLQAGVAFHNSDLTPEERRVVEDSFRSGAVRVVVSTSTLAVGLNLPARNVFIAPEKWRYDARFGMPWKAPILRGEYENMGGRAGRYGAGHDYGRSIVVAGTPFEAETLWRQYVEGEREPVAPQLSRSALEDHIIPLVASRACRSEDDLIQYFRATLTGRSVWQEHYTEDEWTGEVRAAIYRTLDTGALALNDDGVLETTPFGRAVALKGLTLETARELEAWIAESETRRWCELDLLLAAALTPEGRMAGVALKVREYEEADYPGRLRRAVPDSGDRANVPLNRFVQCSAQPFFEEVRAMKTALLLFDWIEHSALYALEEMYDTLAGQVLAAAEQLGWLVEGAAAIATAQGADPAFLRRLFVLAERVERGLQEEAIPLGRVRARGLSRSAIVALAANGLHTSEAIATTSEETLALWLPGETAAAVCAWARRAATTTAADTVPHEPTLVIDARRPGRVQFAGVEIALQEKQYQLLYSLARRPGECVSYEELYRAVWGELVVEDAQLYSQKSALLRRLREAAPDHAPIIETVPKHGFMLVLPPEHVALRATAAAACG